MRILLTVGLLTALGSVATSQSIRDTSMSKQTDAYYIFEACPGGEHQWSLDARGDHYKTLAIFSGWADTEILSVRPLSAGWAITMPPPHCFPAGRLASGATWVCGTIATMAPMFFPVDGVPVLTVASKSGYVEVWVSRSCAVTERGAECRR